MHRFTGVAPRVSLHIPWDRVDDYGKLAEYAADRGVEIGAINANLFQDDDYRLGSVANPDPAVRRKAIDHLLECIDIMDATGSRTSSCGSPTAPTTRGRTTSAPGRTGSPTRCGQIYDRLGDGQRMLLEYKFFEPSFYAMDMPDWGTSFVHCLALGPQAQVVLDTGHHAPGTNIEFIVALLLRAGRLGAFDFNSRYYADDDLIVGVRGPVPAVPDHARDRPADALAPAAGVNFMLDQCHNIEPKIPRPSAR